MSSSLGSRAISPRTQSVKGSPLLPHSQGPEAGWRLVGQVAGSWGKGHRPRPPSPGGSSDQTKPEGEPKAPCTALVHPGPRNSSQGWGN